MSKKVIFLSHIGEEGLLGTMLKDRLEADFLSLIDVFVSSDARSIPPGDAWLKAVDDHLDKASALIVLASPESVKRPWITFETGAGWAKKVPTILLCHSGMAPGALPLPLGQLQAFQPSDLQRLEAMYKVIAGVLGSAIPRTDLAGFSAAILKFEREHTEERDILSALRTIQAADSRLIPWLKSIQPTTSGTAEAMPEALFRKIESDLERLRQRQLLQYTFGINGMGFAEPGGSGGGSFGNLIVQLSLPIVAALQRPEFS